MSLKNTSYFNPTLISGCTLWLDGADPAGNGVVPAVGSTLSSWIDKSITQNNFTGTNVTYTFDSTYGAKSPTFNGNSEMAQTNTSLYSINNVSTLSFFCVSRNTGGGLATIYNGNTSTQTNYILYRYSSSSVQWYGGDAVSVYPVSTDGNGNGITSFIVNPSGIGTGYVNGTSFGSGGTSSSSGQAIFILGHQYTGGAYLTGYIYEFIIYNTALSTVQRQQIEGYLAWKWRLTSSLPASHPYALSPSFGLPSLVPNATAKTSLTYANHPVVAISGCALWLDASDSSTISYSSGSNLSQWRDKSGNGYIMTNNTGTTTVASADLNSLNTIYTPSGTSTQITNFRGRSKMTLFVVGKCAAGRYLLGMNNGCLYLGNDSLLYMQPPTGNYLDIYDTVGLGTSVVSNNTWFLMCIGYDNATNSTANPYTINGSPNNGTNRTTAIVPRGTPGILTDQVLTNSFWINSINGTNSYDSDYTAEIIYYNSTLSVTQRQTIEGYLADKWGLTTNLPVGHPYKSSFPSYPLEITALRRVASRRWSPLTPGGCVLWLDGSDSSTFTLSSTSITQWRDKSGNGNHMANNGTGPIYNGSLINSLGGIDCTNGGSLISSGFQNSANLSFAMVAVVKSGLGFWGSFFTHGGRDFDFAVERNSVVGSTIHFQTANDNSQCGIAYTVDAPVLYYGTMTSGTSRFFQSFSGGTNTTTTGTNSSTISLGSQLARVGKSDNNEVCNSFIGEIIYYTAVLGATQQQQVEGYLAWKWGLRASLPSSHPYKLFPPSP